MRCGRQMRWEPYNVWFNPNTGEQEFDLTWWCPRRDVMFIPWGHSKWHSDINGDTYAYEI